jgi:glycosyltransferase involved in cell wall biosynthesis
MPSLDLEGFGLATAEALACGTPVLASRAGANPELVKPLNPDLMFEPGDVEFLAQILGRVLDGSLRLPEREACATYARSAFRWDRPADAIERAHGRWAVSGWPEGVA